MQIHFFHFLLIGTTIWFVFRQPGAKKYLHQKSIAISHVKAAELIIAKVNQLSNLLQSSQQHFDRFAYELIAKLFQHLIAGSALIDWLHNHDSNRYSSSNRRDRPSPVIRFDQCRSNRSFDWHQADDGIGHNFKQDEVAWCPKSIYLIGAMIGIICIIWMATVKHWLNRQFQRCTWVSDCFNPHVKPMRQCQTSHYIETFTALPRRRISELTESTDPINPLYVSPLHREMVEKMSQNELEQERMRQLFCEAINSYDRVLQQMQIKCHNLSKQV